MGSSSCWCFPKAKSSASWCSFISWFCELCMYCRYPINVLPRLFLSLVLALVAISLFTHLIRIPFLYSLINSYIFMRCFFMSIFAHMFACIIGFLYYSWFSNSLSCLSNRFFLFGRSGKLISIKHRPYALHSHIWKVMAPYRMSNTKTHL